LGANLPNHVRGGPISRQRPEDAAAGDEPAGLEHPAATREMLVNGLLLLLDRGLQLGDALAEVAVV
jgi:hypothetical protein